MLNSIRRHLLGLTRSPRICDKGELKEFNCDGKPWKRLCAAMSCNTETKDRDKPTKCIRPYLMSMERHEVKASRTGRDMHQQQLGPVQAPGLKQRKCATKANTTKHLTREKTSIGTFKHCTSSVRRKDLTANTSFTTGWLWGVAKVSALEQHWNEMKLKWKTKLHSKDSWIIQDL